MKASNYHHGNLKEALITTGIEVIKDEGLDGFSLRKVASKCGVSHSAPHNHFKDKDSLILAIQEYITNNFTEVLKDIYSTYKDSSNVLVELGKGYIKYFCDNNCFYYLLFQHKTPIFISYDQNYLLKSTFAPFVFFTEVATEFLLKLNIPTNQISDDIVTMWSIVHGLTTIYVSNHFVCDEDYLSLCERILLNKFVL